MKNNVLLGLWCYLLPIPAGIWQGQVKQSAVHNQQDFGSLSSEAQQVRNFAVREIPRLGRPLSPELIAQGLGMTVAQVNGILEDLEKRMSFLYRDGSESVVWAYPVTAAKTPHRAVLSSGESIYAA
jgi:hypothetical protein